MSALVLPGAGFGAPRRRSSLALHWRASDLSLTALSGQVATFARASRGSYIDSDGHAVLSGSAAPRWDVQDSDGDGIRDRVALLLENARTNATTFSDAFDNGIWVPINTTVAANVTSAPDGSLTADKLAEDGTNNSHQLGGTVFSPTANTAQSLSLFLKAAERTWAYVSTRNLAGVFATSWVNLATGAIGTKAASHTMRVTRLVDGWVRIEVAYNSSAGASSCNLFLGVAMADNTSVYAGTAGSGIYLWREQRETDQGFPSSAMFTNGGTFTRSGDDFSLPFLVPPRALTLYLGYFDYGLGEIAQGGEAWAAQLGSISGSTPRLTAYVTGAKTFGAFLDDGLGHGRALATTLLSVPGDYVEHCISVAYPRMVLSIRKNGGAREVVTATDLVPPYAYAAAWASAVLGFGNQLTQKTGIGLVVAKIDTAGERTLEQMAEAY